MKKNVAKRGKHSPKGGAHVASAQAPKNPAKPKKKFWNYPRAGKGRIHRWLPSWRFILASVFGVIGLGVAAFAVLYVTTDIPEADEMALAQTTTVYYGDGETEMGGFADIAREPVKLADLPDYVGHAVISSEDQSFYTNNGIDLRGIGRALINNAKGGATQGGSTLTQQYVERYYLGTTTSYGGKLKEAILALKIDREQSKDEILENYLNTIYYGRGAYGIEMAAQRYFGISASELDVSQAAMLAGIIPAPSAWDPESNPEKAESRWHGVLGNMVSEGYLTQDEADALTFPETVSTELSDEFSGPTGYLLTTAKSELVASGEFTEDEINTRGLKIVTTIDKDMQQAAVDAVATLPEDRPDNNYVTLTSADPRTGAIYAMYAGADYKTRERNGVTQDRAQGGSTFKPFALLAHIEQGGTLWDTFKSYSPMDISGIEIQNFDGSNRGTINLATATAYSVNTVYVQLNQEVGPAATREVAVRAGLPDGPADGETATAGQTPGLDDALTNVLGSASPHPIDMLRAYSTFANRGVKHDIYIVKEVYDADGKLIYSGENDGEKVFEQDDVDTLNYALQGTSATGATAETAGLLGRPVAGKTGTSSGPWSAWYIGYIPQMVTAVDMYQIGENGEEEVLTPFGEYWYGIGGGSFPAEVWLAYMQKATEGMEVEDFADLPDSAGVPQSDPVTVAPVEEEPEPQVTVSEAPATEPTESTVTEAPTVEPTENTGGDGGDDSGTGGGGTGGGGTGGDDSGGSGSGGGTDTGGQSDG